MAQSRFEDAAKEFESAYAMDPAQPGRARRARSRQRDPRQAEQGPGPEAGVRQRPGPVRPGDDDRPLSLQPRGQGLRRRRSRRGDRELREGADHPAHQPDRRRRLQRGEGPRGARAGAVPRRSQADRDREAHRLEEIKSVEREKAEAERLRISADGGRQVPPGRASCSSARSSKRSRSITDEILCLDYAHCGAIRLKECARKAELDMAKCENIAAHRENWLRVLEEVLETRIPHDRRT